MSDELPSTFHIEPARPEDVDAVLGILNERCKWLSRKGVKQWPAEGFAREVVEEAVSHGDVYLARAGKEVVGTITLNWDDPNMWGDQMPDAGYIHRMATHRSWGGRGVGEAMIAWAVGRTLEEGRQFLRLDCVSEGALPEYYRRFGFEVVGERSGNFPTSSLMQRPLDPA